MYSLSIKNGVQRGRSWLLESECTTIGRDASCDIVLGDQHVSRRQFKLVLKGENLCLIDLGGKNSTLHNGVPTEESVLTVGDEISAGSTVFQVLCQTYRVAEGSAGPVTETRSISTHEIFTPGIKDDGTPWTSPGHSVEELVELFQFTRELSEAGHMEKLLAVCESWIQRLFCPQGCRIHQYDTDVNRWYVTTESGCASGQTPQLALSDMPDNRGALHRGHDGDGAITTRMLAPLIVSGKTVGALTAEAVAPARVFDESDLQLFCSVARIFSPFLHSADRYDRLSGAYDQLLTAEEARYAIVGNSAEIQRVRELADSAATHSLPVLVLGETGAGKELVAGRIHRYSERRDRPYVTVNCAAIPSDLFESEFFGHMRGAFTGAVREREGRVAEADGGTLFLDEIGELKGENQAKLLRFLESGEYHKIGDPAARVSTARILAASNRDLLEMVTAGAFRSDFYYRLCGQVIHVPALRQRREDIGPLAIHFFEQARIKAKRPLRGISRDGVKFLEQQEWPGNVRELRLTVERAVHVGENQELNASDFAVPFSPVGVQGRSAFSQTLEAVTRNHIAAVLAECNGDVDEAAARLGMGRTTLYGKIKQYGLRKEG